MKPHTLNWLSCSILLVVAISCKKKAAGLFDDFPPGKFDFVWVINHNGVKDTMIGEVSGPYPMAGGVNYFQRKLMVGESELAFEIREQNGKPTNFNLKLSSLYNSNVVAYNLSTSILTLSFEAGDTLSGTFNLTRK